jgi:hypothetical protein
MKALSRLQTLWTSLSLFILALGFTALGFISIINKVPGCGGGIFSAERAYSFIGGAFAVLVGATFLIAAIAYRGQGSMMTDQISSLIEPN